MDDVFDQDGDELELGSRDYERRQEIITKNGLRDGIHKGKENGLQKGFDDGYEKVFPIYESIGFLRGFANVVFSSAFAGKVYTKSIHEETKGSYAELMKNIDIFEKNLTENWDRLDLDEAEERFDHLKKEAINLCELTESPVNRDLLLSCKLSALCVDRK